jgi:hypothetical protein
MNRVLSLAVLILAPLSQGTAQRPWHARERWQLELANGGMIFECQLRERSGDKLLVVESDSIRGIPLATLTGIRLIRPAAKTVGGGARGTFGALAGADDEVYQLTLLTVPERRAVVDSLLQRHPPHS